MLIGGLAVAVWGEPRLTRDVDFKVGATRAGIDRLLEVLGPGCVPASPEAVSFAHQTGVLFLQAPEQTRIDLLLAEAGFDHLALSRGVLVEVAQGVSARLCSPEDLVIYKLLSTRPRDREDALSVVRRQADKLDDAYVEDMLGQFEAALDDSSLLEIYRSLRQQGRTAP